MIPIPSINLPRQRLNALFDCAHDAEDVFQPVVPRARKDQLGEAKLPHTAHALEKSCVEQPHFPRGQLYRAPYGIVDLFGSEFPAVAVVQPLQQRRQPVVSESVEFASELRR